MTSDRRKHMRLMVDAAARICIRIGGFTTIVAVLLICIYLFSVAVPLFFGNTADAPQQVIPTKSLPAPDTLHAIVLEEHGKDGIVAFANGYMAHFSENGTLHTLREPIESITAAEYAASSRAIAVGTDTGRVHVALPQFAVRFPNDVRTVFATVDTPTGSDGLLVDTDGRAVTTVTAAMNEDGLFFAAQSGSRLSVFGFRKEDDWMTGTTRFDETFHATREEKRSLSLLRITEDGDVVLARTAPNQLAIFDTRDDLRETARVTLSSDIRVMTLLVGHTSLLIGEKNGTVSQWFIRYEGAVPTIVRVRSFPGDAPVTHIVHEPTRKGFAVFYANGTMRIFHTTAAQKVVEAHVDGSVFAAAFSLHATRLVIAKTDGIQAMTVHNEHPEVSWSALWRPVWYENYPAPDYVWQSSAATSDFEPKFSFMPLTVGTMKAALYAMLFSVPLALAGALYTAQYAAPRFRRVVKPTVEIMEALPTVILGFLAGLLLAPIIEDNLIGVLLTIVFLPVMFLLCAGGIRIVPQRWQHGSVGYEAFILLPVVFFAVGAAFWIGDITQRVWIGGSASAWVENTFGIDYDQRNGIVVGLAMGFAVIPTIFSIAEDAFFSVPRHLIQGSLALGANMWQTMARVVIPAASPALFSAVMMGLGRAVGETMIVLMASGNTPLLDFSVFSGMRPLSANIAIEMPEAEVGSTHFRLLFLTALLLFCFTLVFNTAAEIVRQRIGTKYKLG